MIPAFHICISYLLKPTEFTLSSQTPFPPRLLRTCQHTLKPSSSLLHFLILDCHQVFTLLIRHLARKTVFYVLNRINHLAIPIPHSRKHPGILMRTKKYVGANERSNIQIWFIKCVSEMKRRLCNEIGKQEETWAGGIHEMMMRVFK